MNVNQNRSQRILAVGRLADLEIGVTVLRFMGSPLSILFACIGTMNPLVAPVAAPLAKHALLDGAARRPYHHRFMGSLNDSKSCIAALNLAGRMPAPLDADCAFDFL